MNKKSLAAAFCLIAAPMVAGAQIRGGITTVQLLALQQQMRDEGCGNARAPGVWNAETRRAIVACSKKYNSSTNARELLTAMNIGFSGNDDSPNAGAAGSTSTDSGMNLGAERGNNLGVRKTTTTTQEGSTTVTTPIVTPENRMMRDSTMMRDSSMRRDSTVRRDSTSKQ